jgi:hypothetical protein
MVKCTSGPIEGKFTKADKEVQGCPRYVRSVVKVSKLVTKSAIPILRQNGAGPPTSKRYRSSWEKLPAKCMFVPAVCVQARYSGPTSAPLGVLFSCQRVLTPRTIQAVPGRSAAVTFFACLPAGPGPNGGRKISALSPQFYTVLPAYPPVLFSGKYD